MKQASDYRAARRNLLRRIEGATWEGTGQIQIKRLHLPPVHRNRAKRWDDADKALMQRLVLNPGG